jgi:MoxR-like ATPase
LILDEVDFASPKILQRLQDVLQNRTLSVIENGGEIVKAEDSFMVVATYNNGYRHSNKLNEAFLDRFGIKLRFDYDNEIEKQVIPSKSLLQLADSMRADSINGVYSTPVTLRLLKSFVTIAQDTTYEFAVENFVMNFNEEERPSVKLLLEAHRHNLESELINN